VTPPQNGTFVMDLGARTIVANADPNVNLVTANPLKPVTSSPTSGEYTVSNTGVYHFFDSETKLISYVYKIGIEYNLPAPNILQICSADVNVKYQGQTFIAGTLANGSPAIQRSKISTKLGLEVSSIDITVFSNPDVVIASAPFEGTLLLSYIVQGLMDGASVLVQRGFSSTPDFAGVASMGTIIAFSGTVANTKVGRSSASITVKSKMELLDIQMPRMLYNAGCQNVLFDNLCGISPTDYISTGTVQAGSNQSVIKTNLSKPGALPNPTASPNLFVSSQNAQNIQPSTIYGAYTYLDAYGGETLVSPQGSFNLSKNWVGGVRNPSGLNPPAPSGAVSWNCYMGYGPGDFSLQNFVPIPLGDDFPSGGTTPNEILNGINTAGSPPPVFSTTGYYAQGVMTFTSGANIGISRVVSNYTNTGGSNGIVTVVPLFPYAVAEGDSFSILPGCNKTTSQCTSKFDNLLNYAGMPYIPLPTTGSI